MNRIKSLFWQKKINNQPEISCLLRWQWNTVVKANYLFSTFYYQTYLISHHFFCSCLLCSSDNQSLMRCTYQNFPPNTNILATVWYSVASGQSGCSKCPEQKWCGIYIGNAVAHQWTVTTTPVQSSDRRSKKQQWSKQALWPQQMTSANMVIATINQQAQQQQNMESLGHCFQYF